MVIALGLTAEESQKCWEKKTIGEGRVQELRAGMRCAGCGSAVLFLTVCRSLEHVGFERWKQWLKAPMNGSCLYRQPPTREPEFTL